MPKVTSPRMNADDDRVATYAMTSVIWKFSASLASTFVNVPRSLKTSQMISDGRKLRMPPRCANEAH